MPLSRRDFLVASGALTGWQLLSPIAIRAGRAFGATTPDPLANERRRLVVIFLQGGNDGLNTVIPIGDASGTQRYSVYRQVRPSIGYLPGQTLPLVSGGDADQMLGLNSRLSFMHALYSQERVAIVQGVDYPAHSYSHFVSTDIWESGQPGEAPDSGWVGRHLDRAGIGDGELRGLGVGTDLPLILRGIEELGVEIASIPAMRFSDGSGAAGVARHEALARYATHPVDEPLRRFAGEQAAETVGVVSALSTIQTPPTTGNRLADQLLTARTLLESPLGVEVVHVRHGGFDTHTSQRVGHEALLRQLDQALEAFYLGTIDGAPVGSLGPLSPGLVDRTLVMTTSEFGRRIGENGAGAGAGTDHGAAGPLFLIGPPSSAPGPALVTGLHGDHPAMGTTLAPVDNLAMTTELRRIYQAVLWNWLADPDPVYDDLGYDPLPGLFA
jgi:uncharacterized protein (DUF1501 family)